MNEKIANIIEDSSNKGNQFSNNEIRKILEIIIKYNNLEEFVKSMHISDKSKEKTVAYYNQTDLELVIYVNHLYEYLQKKNNWEKIIDLNLLFVGSLFHEIEHVKQYRKTTTSDTDFETELIRVNYNYFKANIFVSIYRKFLYKKYHDAFPLERLADIDSTSKMLEIAKLFNKEEDYQKLYNHFLTSFYLDPILYLSPTEAFLDRINSNLLRDQDFYDPYKFIMLEKVSNKYTLEERLRLGLPITSCEYSLIRNR